MRFSELQIGTEFMVDHDGQRNVVYVKRTSSSYGLKSQTTSPFKVYVDFEVIVEVK